MSQETVSMIHANLRYKTLGYPLTVLKSGRRVTTAGLIMTRSGRKAC